MTVLHDQNDSHSYYQFTVNTLSIFDWVSVVFLYLKNYVTDAYFVTIIDIIKFKRITLYHNDTLVLIIMS